MDAINISHARATAAAASGLMKVLSNQDRFMLLCQIAQGEKCVSDLEIATGIKQPTLSQQLTVLREEKLVSTRREGKRIFYSIHDTQALGVVKAIYQSFNPAFAT